MSHYRETGDPDFPSARDGMETHTFECDERECSASFSSSGTFSEVWADAKQKGWHCFKNKSDVWEHRCPRH